MKNVENPNEIYRCKNASVLGYYFVNKAVNDIFTPSAF